MTETLQITAPIGFVFTLAVLWQMRNELIRARAWLDLLRGQLPLGSHLPLERIHAAFSGRSPGKPTLLFLTAAGCDYCDPAFSAVLRILPRGAVNLCVGYRSIEGTPAWSQAAVPIQMAPVEDDWLDEIRTELLPRMILLSPADRVQMDLSGYVEGVTEFAVAKALGLRPPHSQNERR